ncbi:hypothetical protein [Chryseobacterium echinoideorum]|uniref:hypothetical protein n=1 Tax=Chryseobacterium echinoideorum TaxID=1549648 RepID=UPI00118600EB|nr:hypothetical protein [Chryseobacterium echinoideorum]
MKKKLLLILILNLFFSCNAQNKHEKRNTKINESYLLSRKQFQGKLDSVQLKQIRTLITNELKVEIEEDKSIFINYFQYAKNCSEYSLKEKYANQLIDNYIKLSSKISTTHHAVDFFVFTNDAVNKERFEKRENYIKDSGFFAQTIFTLQENCRAFFLLKPNGEFLKHYGSDYFIEVENFLKKK